MIDFWESLFRTLTALAIVLALMGIVAMTARRFMTNRIGSVGTRPLVQVLASGYVAPRKSISLISVAGEYLIVGTTATEIVSLGRVTDPAKMEDLLNSSPSPMAPPAPASLSSAFSSWIKLLPIAQAPSQKGNHGRE